MRWLSFIVKWALVVGVVVWLADRPGTAHVVWHDYVIETTAAFLALAVLTLAFVLFSGYRLWRFLWDGPRFWRLRRMLKRHQRGQAQVTAGLVAIAAGNAAEAGRLAVSARKLLGPTSATRLLQAQAAQLAGDHGAAREIFKVLAQDPATSVLGFRGLIMEAVRGGQWDEAQRQVEQLAKTKPDTPWLGLIQFELATRRHDWSAAAQALARATSARLLEPPRARRHQAALFLAAAEEEARQGQAQIALQSAERAVRLAPDWLPASLVLAQRQMATRHARAAWRTLEKAWTREPQAQLAQLARELDESGKPLGQFKQIERLTRAAPESPVSQLALAEAAFDADLWGEARRHLLALAQRKDATQAVFRLLARLERRESGDEQAATRWLMKALDAVPDPRWLCARCGGGHEAWHPVCLHCGGFDGLAWQSPGASRATTEGGASAGLLEAPYA